MDLDKDQTFVLKIIKRGFNTFLTGRAGTGKTRVLKALKTEPNVFYTAPTGKAASNIAGKTVHAFAGKTLVYSSIQCRKTACQ